MKFKIETAEKAQFGDGRDVHKFAWLPVYCDHYIVWLECYKSIQRFDSWGNWVEIDRKELW